MTSTRSALARTTPAPPVRIVHLGLGAFSRSHTAWYTARAHDAAQWGIAAYTGSSVELAAALTEQDGVYTLIARSADTDAPERVESIVRAHAGGDLPQLIVDLSAPTTAIVTLTITEAGYRADHQGGPDRDDPLVRADLAALAGISTHDDLEDIPVQTALGRLVVGLEARRRAGAGPLALVSCDNLPDNGGLLRTCVLALAASNLETERWCDANVAFVSSSVDRITPRLEDDELRAMRARFEDAVPVVAEEFSDWVVSGDFPAGRPSWESAGVRFTDELEPWEARKLWLLNGAHTILACLGPLRGHDDIAGAISDPACRQAVEDFWDEAEPHLPDGLGLADYRSALLERFANPRIVHRLSQIAIGTPTKLRLRIVPVAERERGMGRSASACASALAAWIASGNGYVEDAAVRVREVSPTLADDVTFLGSVERSLIALGVGALR